MCSCSREGFQAPQPQTVATPARLERESLGSFLQAVGGPMCSCSREGWQAPQQEISLATDAIAEEPAPQDGFAEFAGAFAEDRLMPFGFFSRVVPVVIVAFIFESSLSVLPMSSSRSESTCHMRKVISQRPLGAIF